MNRSGVVRRDVPIRAHVTTARGGAALARRAMRAAMTACVALLAACYTFSGGGGLPRNLRTVAVQPFDNQTAAPDLQREIALRLQRELREKLSLREAPEARANVLVRGTIVRYEVDLPAGVSADPRQTTSTRRLLQLVADVEVLDQTTGRALFKQAGVSSEKDYAEGSEPEGRRQAIETLVTRVIEKMQSQW